MSLHTVRIHPSFLSLSFAHSFACYFSFNISLSLTHTHILPLYSVHPKSLQVFRSLALPHSHIYSTLKLSWSLAFVTFLASHSLASSSIHLSHCPRSSSRPSKSFFPQVKSLNHASRSRILVYQAYLQRLSAGFGLGSFIGNIHLHSSSSIVDIQQTGTYSLCLSRALVLSLAFSRSLSR